MLGSDPEAFVIDTKGNVVSAIGIIEGTKDRPLKTLNGSIQHDNILAEFNSKPASTIEEFINNHRLIIKDLKDYLKPLNLDIEFSAAKVIEDFSILMHPDAQRAGCDPDFNAWTGQANIAPAYGMTNVRGAGGHIHISFPNCSLTKKREVVKALDLFLGVPSILLDTDTLRRQVYGKAGAFRPKLKKDDGYNGLEYRVLSNFWLNREEYMAFVWNNTHRVLNNMDKCIRMANDLSNDIVDIINTSDKIGAAILCDEYNLLEAA